MKKYTFKPYSKIFPELFQREFNRIASSVNTALVIEHIGSTAVPGLGGKGIIDIGIAVDKKNMELVSKKLQALGYEFRPNFSTIDRFYFIAYLPDPEEGTRRYHIHLTYPENPEWKEFLGFRDYLRSHPKALQDYAELKQEAVSEAKDEGERYRKIKEPMFKKINAEIKTVNKPLDVNIRSATLEDANTIVEAERTIAEEPGYFCSQPSELTIENVINTITSAKNGNGLYLVAEFDGKIVGHAFLEIQHLQSLRHVADLNIAVDLGWQNQGIGTRLLKQIIEWAKESAMLRKIQLNVRATNSKAISLYKKLGFEEEGKLKDQVKVKDGYIDDIIMGLNLVKDQDREDTVITVLEKKDIDSLVNQFCFPWSSVEATLEKWTRYLSENQQGIRTVYLLHKNGIIIGYANLLYISEYPNFSRAGIPEINDLWIAESWHNKGFGKKLIIHLENIARKKKYSEIGLGVGLYKDYGQAQKLYFRLGYVPDGHGITYKYQSVTPGKEYFVDDDLILWLKKKL